MTTASKKMGARGVIVIPKKIREESGIGCGSRIEIVPMNNGALIIPVKNFSETSGLFKDIRSKKMSMKQLDMAYLDYISSR